MTEARMEPLPPEEDGGAEDNYVAPTQAELDAASAKKFDDAQKVNEPENIVNSKVTERPDYVPEKFWKDDKVDVEGLLKGYSELETKLGSNETVPKSEEETPVAEDNASQEETPAVEGTFDFNAASEEFARDGKLSDNTLALLDKAGIPKDAVDMFAEGMEHYASKQIDELQGMVGGAEDYGKMIDWAVANLDQAGQDAFDKALTSGHETAKLAIQGLHAKYKSAVGTEGEYLKPDGQNQTPGGFDNKEQMLSAMRDPRYASDPAFRMEVQRKLESANWDW
jgi:hypothetical protein